MSTASPPACREARWLECNMRDRIRLPAQVLLVLGGAILGIAVGWLIHKRRRLSVYLIDLACYAPPSSLNITNNELVQLGYQSGVSWPA